MLKFTIKNAYYGGKTVGYLYYDEQKKSMKLKYRKP